MKPVHGLVDHLFRREAGRMVAALTRSFGAGNLALAEEVVQEALLQALRRWPYHGVPDKPAAWLARVARNLALDHLRRDANLRSKEKAIRDHLGRPAAQEESESVFFTGEITDDSLRLIFLTCHPDLPRDQRVALTLKTVCGFGAREIARAFLVRETAMAQRLVRAQRFLRERRVPFEVPPPAELQGRLAAVLEVVYLLFNEGYGAHQGDALVRADLCTEALRLSEVLAGHAITENPETHALAALLGFQTSRLPARVDEHGDLVLLADQDRSRWDRRRIGRAFRHLEQAAAGDEMSDLHLQAAIAAHHAAAPSDEATDWAAILELYDRLLARNPSPVVALNRAVALARVRGPRAGLEALDGLEEQPAAASYHLLPATRAELLLRVGDPRGAAEALRRALACPCSEPERRLLARRLVRAEDLQRPAGGV